MSRHIDAREPDRESHGLSRDGRGRGASESMGITDDARDALTRDLDLPQGPSREHVRRRSWEGDLRGSEVRVLATAGAFRVVPMDELRRPDDRPHVHRKDVERLRGLDLVRTMPSVVGGERTTVVTLTERGRAVLEESRRHRADRPPQAFYAGVVKPRELAHDACVHRAYREAAGRLADHGVRVTRVVLEQDLKREYQAFLQAPNRGRRTSAGRPQRDADEIARWAHEHALPMFDGHVHFPDVRLECEGRDGRRQVEDVEVMTPHYRGAHAAAKVRAGFTRVRAMGARLGGASGATRAGRGRDAHLAEEMLS